MRSRVGRLMGLFFGVWLLASYTEAFADCSWSTSNSISAENACPGTPQSQWDISGAGDSSIQGFATDISVNQGGTISFKIKTSKSYTIDIYRMGYYGGNGGNVIQAGDGIIPNLAFSLSGKVARLNVDTSAIPGFNLYIGTGGVLDVTWTQTSDWNTRTSGATKIQFGNIITRWSGSDYVFSAKATGTLIGLGLTEIGLCKIGKSQSKGFEVEYP